MTPNPINRKLTVVQETLDQLFGERLIPFEINAQSVHEDRPGEFQVALFDCGIHSFEFTWKDGDSFKEVLRMAVMDRTKEMGTPLNDWIM